MGNYYIAKHAAEFSLGDFTPEEIGRRRVDEFLAQNEAAASFNKRQSIMLVSSSFNAQTLSAAAWLSSNGIDIECLSLNPVRIGGPGGPLCLAVETLVPVPSASDLLIGFPSPSDNEDPAVPGRPKRARTILPTMSKLLEWGVVKVGQTLHIKGHPCSEATVLNASKVCWRGQDMTFNGWGKTVTGWSVIGIYQHAADEQGQTLADLRAERMKQEQEAEAASVAEV